VNDLAVGGAGQQAGTFDGDHRKKRRHRIFDVSRRNFRIVAR
jgi:hypothetical protein